VLRPIELDGRDRVVLPDGQSVDSALLWNLFGACRTGDRIAVERLVAQAPGLVHGEYNYTQPIHFAVREGHADVVSYLLERGADPTYRTYGYRDTLRTMARERGRDAVARIIEETLSARFPIDDRVGPLLLAAGAGDMPSVREQVEGHRVAPGASDEVGQTALHAACAAGHGDVVRYLLDRGADVQACRSDGFTPLHSALFSNGQGWVRTDPEPVGSLRAGRIAGLLLERGAEYNIFIAAVLSDDRAVLSWLEKDASYANFSDTHARRPLSAAAWRGDLDMVRLLLAHGADPTLPERDSPRGHALWIAAFRGDLDMARLLLAHGADPEATADAGGRALDHARAHPALYELLVEHGADPRDEPFDRLHDALNDGDQAAVRSILSQDPTLVNDPRLCWGEGSLAVAASQRDWEMIDVLLGYGAQVPVLTKWGRSYYVKHLDVARYLLERGMDPNQTNWHGTSLLHDLAFFGPLEGVQLLVEHGADIHALDEEYCSTPLGLAARAGRLEIVEWLLAQGADPVRAAAEWATPLAWAAQRGHDAVLAALSNGKWTS
jgi:ankyrin repeat protein